MILLRKLRGFIKTSGIRGVSSCLPKMNILTKVIVNWKISHWASTESLILLNLLMTNVPIICSAIQLTSFYMMGTLVIKRLKLKNCFKYSAHDYTLRMPVAEIANSVVFSRSVWIYKRNTLWKTSFCLMRVKPGKE